ncbi:hypothetical protein Taro_027864 [Colocasia esculenta]|uniref:Transposase n=1 Tax=Colocasia esculenta TaxID=4460 RepID=A0A843VQ33_COLES|nr:hypothetical protein [Colocasia esculenta]
MLKSKHYKGKTFEDVFTSIPAGVDPLDWQTICEKWNTREEKERMTQMTTPSLQSDDVTLVSVEDAFIDVMGRDRPARVRCTGKAKTLDSWYGRREGSSSSDGYHTQVQQLQDQNKKMEELCAERSRNSQKLEDMRSQRLEM